MRLLRETLPKRTRLFFTDENGQKILCEINQDPNNPHNLQAKRFKQDGEPTYLGDKNILLQARLRSQAFS